MLGHLIDAFLISAVAVATDSERQRNSNPRKVYPADPGLLRAFDASGRSNVGHALETAVLNELERRGAEVAYVKTRSGYEVDFLVRLPAGQEELIQVAAEAGEGVVAGRELRALAEAGQVYPRAIQRLLTLTQDGLPAAVPSGVRAQPAYEWMLEAANPD